MKIALVNHGQQQNFRGILLKTNNTVLKELKEGKKISTHEEEYSYFPFADEQFEEIEKIRKKYNWSCCNYCAPATYSIIEKTVQINAPLSITKAQYKALKTKVDDNFIIETFA